MKLVKVFFISLCLIFVITYSVNAVLTESGEKAPIAKGENLLAAAVFNDAPGSSDLTLIVQLKVDGKIVVDEGSKCKVIQPLENIPNDKEPTGWTQPNFDDSDWQDGKYGVGYGDNDDNTVIGDGNHASVYTRAIFEVKSISKNIELGVDFDDGTVVWINGVEVARESGTDIPDLPEWDSWTDIGSGHSHEASKQDPPRYEVVKLPVKVISSPFPVNDAGKLATTWSKIKTKY